MRNIAFVIIIAIDTQKDRMPLDPEIVDLARGACSRYERRDIPTVCFYLGPSSAIDNIATKEPIHLHGKENNLDRLCKHISLSIRTSPLIRTPPSLYNNVAIITIGHGGLYGQAGIKPYFLARLIIAAGAGLEGSGYHIDTVMVLQCVFAAEVRDLSGHSMSNLEKLKDLLPAIRRITGWSLLVMPAPTNPERRQIFTTRIGVASHVPSQFGKLAYVFDTSSNSYVLRELQFMDDPSDSDTDEMLPPLPPEGGLRSPRVFFRVCSRAILRDGGSVFTNDPTSRLENIEQENTIPPSTFNPIARERWHQDTPNCERCGKQFTLFFRRHHCRNCGRCICNDCIDRPTSDRLRNLICLDCAPQYPAG